MEIHPGVLTEPYRNGDTWPARDLPELCNKPQDELHGMYYMYMGTEIVSTRDTLAIATV